MRDASLHTAQLRGWLDRIQSGDRTARDELVRACHARLEVLARRMLRRYPFVRRWADTDDVFQGAAVRLLRAVEAVPLADTRGFLNLAAAVIRRELIDLARHFNGPMGVGANHASVGPGKTDGPAAPEAEAPRERPGELDRWCALHEAVERLPAEEREVFGLTFYHGWTQAQIAELYQVDERTVRRWWKAACLALHHALGGELPAA
jgi:RNA polymerase sigma-70 factor (ECF subfamily)